MPVILVGEKQASGQDSALRFSLCPGLTAEEMTYTADRLAAQYQVLSRFVRR